MYSYCFKAIYDTGTYRKLFFINVMIFPLYCLFWLDLKYISLSRTNDCFTIVLPFVLIIKVAKKGHKIDKSR